MRRLALGMHTWAPGWVLIETKGKGWEERHQGQLQGVVGRERLIESMECPGVRRVSWASVHFPL